MTTERDHTQTIQINQKTTQVVPLFFFVVYNLAHCTHAHEFIHTAGRF